jgi:CTP synthase
MFKNEALTKMVNLERKLGAQACEFQEDTRIAALYGTTKIKERFSLIREYSRQFLDLFKNTGLLITGYEAETKLPVTLELKSHSHFLAVVYHPEFKSRPLKPHPLFLNFVKCAKEKAD